AHSSAVPSRPSASIPLCAPLGHQEWAALGADVVMDEDQTRNRKDHGPQNLALLRKLALNLAKLDPSKGSMRGKLKQADGTIASCYKSSSSQIFKCDSPA